MKTKDAQTNQQGKIYMKSTYRRARRVLADLFGGLLSVLDIVAHMFAEFLLLDLDDKGGFVAILVSALRVFDFIAFAQRRKTFSGNAEDDVQLKRTEQLKREY